jgi:nucleoside phosphorylase
MRPILRYEDYAIAWICALEVELLAARFMLDEKHDGIFPGKLGDSNDYIAGTIGAHNVVLVSLPRKSTGCVSAAILVSSLKSSFPNLRYCLMVGIGAGVPGPDSNPDIRLGDVVVAFPMDDHDNELGVIGYELGKETIDGFVLRSGSLHPTDRRLRNALGTIKTEAEFSGRNDFVRHLEVFRTGKGTSRTFLHPGPEKDRLYEAGSDRLVVREKRKSLDPNVHYGLIASGDKLIKNAELRDKLRDKYKVICFEMEAAGAMNILPVAVIRGVCDYADCHKNNTWHAYAAATAAAYAKGVLVTIGAHPSFRLPPVGPPEKEYGHVSEKSLQRLSDLETLVKEDLCLLSLDGGGVRGLSTLQIVKRLMETIDPVNPPRPCDYFDMIGGTNTGG